MCCTYRDLMVAWLALALSAVSVAISGLVYLRTVSQDKAVDWKVEKRGRDHVLVCVAGTARDVEIDLGEHNTALSWGQLEHAELHRDDVVRIATYMPSSADVRPDEVEIRWKVGRRSHSRRAQIL